MAKKKASDNNPLSGISEYLGRSFAKKFKDSPVTIFNGGDSDDVTTIKKWVSTGCSELDLAISNIPNGGLPCGRLSIFYGPEQSGKSLIAAHTLANTQKQGGIAIYIDTEYAYHHDFFKAAGVDSSNPDTWMHIAENSLERILTIIEESIAVIRERDQDVLITVVLDSFAGCLTAEEQKGDFALKGYNTSKSIIIANGLNRLMKTIAEQGICFVVTNQVRSKMNVALFEDPWRMPGGQALPHYASVIVRLKKSKAIKVVNKFGVKREIGRQAVASTEKNRLTAPNISVMFNIYYDRGIDDYLSIVKAMKTYGIGKTAGAWISYTHNGKELRESGDKAFSMLLRKNPDALAAIYSEFCEKYITKYRMDDSEYSNEEVAGNGEEDDDEGED